MLEEEVKQPRKRTPGNGAWYGVIASNPSDLQEYVFVVIPAFDRRFRFGPCRWQARDTTSTPTSGDDCLVIFDNNKIPWVTAWWPYD